MRNGGECTWLCCAHNRHSPARRESPGPGAGVAVGAARAARDPVVVGSTTYCEPSHAPADTGGGTEARAKRLTPRRNHQAMF